MRCSHSCLQVQGRPIQQHRCAAQSLGCLSPVRVSRPAGGRSQSAISHCPAGKPPAVGTPAEQVGLPAHLALPAHPACLQEVIDLKIPSTEQQCTRKARSDCQHDMQVLHARLLIAVAVGLMPRHDRLASLPTPCSHLCCCLKLCSEQLPLPVVVLLLREVLGGSPCAAPAGFASLTAACAEFAWPGLTMGPGEPCRLLLLQE